MSELDKSPLFNRWCRSHDRISKRLSGWWCGTSILLSHKLGCCHHPNWRSHIFQRGGPTTNQLWSIQYVIIWDHSTYNLMTWVMLTAHGTTEPEPGRWIGTAPQERFEVTTRSSGDHPQGVAAFWRSWGSRWIYRWFLWTSLYEAGLC